MTIPRVAACPAVVLLFQCAVAVAGEPAQTLKVDAVELVRGREIQGLDSLYLDHNRYRYRFSTEAHRDEFKRNPGRYEIQMGGSCARMGPLSGEGRTDLFGVHDGRIYIFASEACRTTFLANPDNLLEKPDAVAAGGRDADRRGRALLDQAIDAIGGASKIEA